MITASSLEASVSHLADYKGLGTLCSNDTIIMLITLGDSGRRTEVELEDTKD